MLVNLLNSWLCLLTVTTRVILSGDLYCCLLPWCKALRTCCSGFPIATVLYTMNWQQIYAQNPSEMSTSKAGASNTQPACGPWDHFVQPAMLFGKFQGCQVPWKRCREIIEPKLNDTRCGFYSCRSIIDQILTLHQTFE